MCWDTPVGVRSLEGAEADLWLSLAGVYQSILIDMAIGGEPHLGDAGADDRWSRLPWEQQVVAIGEVTRDLLCEISPSPRLSAWNELAIWEVFDFVLSMEEDGVEPEPEFVRVTVEAAVELGMPVESTTPEAFFPLLRALRDRILYDREIDRDMISDVEADGLEVVGLHDEYFAEGFPAFSLNRLVEAMSQFEETQERVVAAVTALPRALRVRADQDMEEAIYQDA